MSGGWAHQSGDALSAGHLRELRCMQRPALQPRDLGYSIQGSEHRRGVGDDRGRGATFLQRRAALGKKIGHAGRRGPELFTASATGQITSNENLQRAINQPPANQPIQQITFAPHITVEAGASEGVDSQFAQEIAEEAYNKVYEDITIGGPIRTALGG